MRAAILLLPLLLAQAQSPDPRFEDYQVDGRLTGTPAAPIIATAEQRMFRSRIRNGVSQGSDLWYGTGPNVVRTREPNFAGYYFAIRWGCGSQCVMMAIVDARTGKIQGSPLPGGGTGLHVNLDLLSDMEIDLRPDSSLLILRNGCRQARSDCGIFYFNWKEDHFELVKFTPIDLMKQFER